MSRTVEAAVDEADLAPAAAHEHDWALMQFALVDDRPVVRQQCGACRLVRSYRAWERYWVPGHAEVRRQDRRGQATRTPFGA